MLVNCRLPPQLLLVPNYSWVERASRDKCLAQGHRRINHCDSVEYGTWDTPILESATLATTPPLSPLIVHVHVHVHIANRRQSYGGLTMQFRIMFSYNFFIWMHQSTRNCTPPPLASVEIYNLQNIILFL